EPTLGAKAYLGHPLVSSLQKFKAISDLIIVNRMVPMFSDVMEKIYTRDLFGIN
ncbi:MAG: UDP-glucose 6-dehydrogenase, partial [Acinetobacter sp.]